MRRPPSAASGLRTGTWSLVLPAALAGAAGVTPGRPAAVAAALLAAIALVHAVWRTLRRRPASRAALAAGFAVPFLIIVASLPELAPLPEPSRLLADGTSAVETSWTTLLENLEGATGDVPPPGGDFEWLSMRQARLGQGSGLAVLDGADLDPVAWRGRTTRLTPGERELLGERLGGGTSLLVLRRGLALRLLYVSVPDGDRGQTGQVVAAEIPLAGEPDPGRLADGLARELEARVRWEAVGEGVRAEVGAQDATDALQTELWSLVPLMGSDGALAGRISLGLLRPSAWRDAQWTVRRAAVSTILAAAIAWLVFAGSLSAWWLIAGRMALLGACGWLAKSPSLHGATRPGEPWSALAGDGALSALIHTPLDAALTGMLLVAIAALPGGVSARSSRTVRLAAGILSVLLGLAIVALLTVRGPLTPGELLLPPYDGLVVRVLSALAMAALPWAGTLLVMRAVLSLSPRRAFALAALIAGLATGLVHGLALPTTARSVAEREIAGPVGERYSTWTDALTVTLEIAVPSAGSAPFTPDRDAIDLWWNSPLSRLGLASAVWKYEPGRWDVPADAFVTGMPPVEPAASLATGLPNVAGPYPRTWSRPAPETIDFVGGDVHLLLSEVQRSDGGSWVAAVLLEPGNLPGRGREDPLRGARLGTPDRPTLRPHGLEPRLAWFDESGALIRSDLAAGPPAPLAPPAKPLWRDADIGGARALLLEIPDRTGTVIAVVFPPAALALAALAVAWGVSMLLIALLLASVTALLADAPATLAAVIGGARRVVRHFRGQLAVSFVVVGLLALLALAGTGRGTARRQAQRLVTNDGARSLLVARELVQAYETFNLDSPLSDGPGDAANRVAAWIARNVGEDISVWGAGELLATSRPDLIRAGLWPERLPGELWLQVAGARRPLAIESLDLEGVAGASSMTIAHGPFRFPDGRPGVVSIPLGSAGARLEEELTDIDRGLLVSSALLVALGILILVPLTRRLVAPLSDLERATALVAGGQFDTPVPETGYEETRALSRAFRQMTDSLSAQQRSLERRRQAIEALIEGMPVALVAYTGAGQVWVENPRARELLSSPGESGRTAAGILEPVVHRARSAKGEASETVEMPGETEGEPSRLLRVSGLDVPGLTDGEAARLVLIEDLTDALRAERLTAWAEMARRIAHEIKNPLTPISLMVEHVRTLAQRDDPRLPEVLAECLDSIAEQVVVLRDTSREFSDYARLLIPRPVPLDLGPAIRRWLAGWVTAPPAGIEVRLDGDPRMAPILADPRLLRRAVVNLVDNAVAAVRNGGSVRVAWSAGEDGDGPVRIDVEDDGPGILPERVASLFQPDVTTRETGSGLGLSIVREAVEAQGGHIDVDPGPGRGARFTIVLPRETTGADTTPRAEDDSPPPRALR